MSLRLFTALIESPLVRPLLLPGLLKRTGVAAFRRRDTREAPTACPLVDPPKTLGETYERQAIAIADEVASGNQSDAPGEFELPSIADYASAYRAGSVTPEQVCERVLSAIERSNQMQPPLRAVIKCEAEDARRQAAESAERLARGEPRSVLEGVPVAIKDELDMPPYTTHVGTRFLGNEIPGGDATPVGRLRSAGAVLVGKTNMYEIGISPTGNNPIHGFARNPHHTDYDAGGSSSGSGAAVGSGIVPLAIGADGGGSIRVPSAHCGVVGLKPTFGRVSEYGAAPLCWSVAHVGPIGATALDVAIGYAICAGRDPKDPISMRQPPVGLPEFHNRDLGGVTLGVYRPWFEDASPEIVGRCKETLGHLEEAGATIKEVTVAGLEATRVAHAITILTEMAAAMSPFYADHRKQFGHPARISLALARQFTGVDYVHAQRVRTEAMREWARVLSEVDAVITPTTACTAPHLSPRSERYGEADMATQTELMRFVVCANFCGLPAISFPAGYSAEGLPIGIQAIGNHWREALLLRLANVADAKMTRRVPMIFHDVLSAGRA